MRIILMPRKQGETFGSLPRKQPFDHGKCARGGDSWRRGQKLKKFHQDFE